MNRTLVITERIRFLIHWPLLILTLFGWLFGGTWAIGVGAIIMGLFHVFMTGAALIPGVWAEGVNKRLPQIMGSERFDRLVNFQFMSFVTIILLVGVLTIVSPERGPFYRPTLLFGAIIMIGGLSNLSAFTTLTRFLCASIRSRSKVSTPNKEK